MRQLIILGLKFTLLFYLIISPVLMIFYFDTRFTALEDSVCKTYSFYKDSPACTYSDLKERERLVTTSFYRHIGDFFGRSVGTSPSWIDSGGWIDRTYDENRSNTSDQEIELYYQDSQVRSKLSDFNRKFAIAMVASFMISAVALTVATQRLLRLFRNQRHK